MTKHFATAAFCGFCILLGCKSPEITTKTTEQKTTNGIKYTTTEYIVPANRYLTMYYDNEVPDGLNYSIVDTYNFTPYEFIAAKHPIKDSFVKDLSYKGIQCNANALIIKYCEPIPGTVFGRIQQYKVIIQFIKIN